VSDEEAKVVPLGPARSSDAWWTISGVALLAALRRVEAGEKADEVYQQLYENAGRTRPGQ
jgi:hypothetical protein